MWLGLKTYHLLVSTALIKVEKIIASDRTIFRFDTSDTFTLLLRLKAMPGGYMSDSYQKTCRFYLHECCISNRLTPSRISKKLCIGYTFFTAEIEIWYVEQKNITKINFYICMEDTITRAMNYFSPPCIIYGDISQFLQYYWFSGFSNLHEEQWQKPYAAES